MADRIVLTDIAPQSWEHPADRAALNALRSIPGFDDVVRRVFSYFDEKRLRQLYLANAVRVSATQRPKLDALLTEVLTSMDWHDRPELYVSQTPVLNAKAIGWEKPFIVIHSAALDQLDDEELRAIVAHELAHIMSGHVVYRTMADLIMTIGLSAMPTLAAAAFLPIHIALMEWYRKSELSADRGELLAIQDRKAAMMLLLKLAGGRDYGDSIDLEAFVEQGKEYETQGDFVDRVWRVINTLMRDHPFATVRAGELQRWIDSGSYGRIIGGEYTRRADAEASIRVGQDINEAAGYYADQAKAAVDRIGEVFGRARGAFDDAFNGGRR